MTLLALVIAQYVQAVALCSFIVHCLTLVVQRSEVTELCQCCHLQLSLQRCLYTDLQLHQGEVFYSSLVSPASTVAYHVLLTCGVLYRVARQIIQAIPAVMYMVVLILFVMVLFSAFASMVVAHDHDDPFLHSFTACFYSLFVLMTTANFPDVMMPSYNNQSWSVLFFIVYVCVMVFILLNLLLAVVFSSFQDLEKTKFRKLLIHKRKVIMLMYDLITRATGEDGITFEHFSGIMKYYKPRMGRRDLRCVYLYLARGNSDRLSRSDCYRIYEVTELKWIQVDRLFNQVPWYSNFPACLFQLFRGPDAFVRSKLFSFLSYFLLLCSFVAMIYIAVWNDYGRVDYVVLVSVFVTLCGLEVLLKLLSAGPIRYFQLFWNMWDMALLVLSLVGFGTGIYALQVLVFMRSFRLLKIFQLKQRDRDVISTVVGLVPQMGNVVMVIILLYYFFAIIGIEAFSGKVFPGCCQSPEFMVATYYKKGNVSNETGFYFLNNFDSILQSYVTLFELMVINNWWIVMNGFVSETSGWVRIFFFVYYFLSLMVLNILVSFILDAFVFHLALSPNGEGREEITSSKKGSKYYHTVRIKVGYNEISDDLSQATFFMFPAEGYLLFQGQRRLTREDFSIQMYSGEVETWLEELELEFRNVEADLGSSARHMMHNRRKYNTIRSDITRNLLVVRRYVEDIIRSPEEGDNDGDGFLIINLDEVAPSENGSASSNGAATAGPVRLPAVDQDAAAAAD
eukprot:scpid43217/ scgid3414/ Two pore calcium channel protein 1; Voltage-dependent calcium channel protein TPC1